MRRAAILAATILMLAAAQRASAAVAGSKHDFTPTGGYPITGVTELCKSCHVPHKPLMNIPLWAHAMSTYTFQMYNTNTGYVSRGGTYDGSKLGKSKLCLGCHDGTVAVAGTTYLTQASNAWILYDGGVKVGGQGTPNPSAGLKGSHPIAVTMPAAASGQFKSIASDADVKLDSTEIVAGGVSCTTCHNPHNKTGTSKMLVKTNAGSALCLTCHDK